jgi:molybdopterin/thiamine biosynthesis adenylyltransferase
MAFSDDEVERYARHIVLRELGGPGQQKLKAAKVLVVGAGGLGAPMLLYLAGAGVGTIGVVDDDFVSLSNLQRQIIHSTKAAADKTAKTDSAATRMRELNPNVAVVTHNLRLDASNAMEIMSGYDIIADGCDNFVTRFLVSDACYLLGKTLVSAAVGQFDAQISTFKPHLRQADGTPYPSYRCLHTDIPPDGMVPSCEEAGILGALTGVAGSMQAMEVIKEIAGIGDSLAGRMVMYDALSARFMVTKLAWNPDNPLNGNNPSITDLSAYR